MMRPLALLFIALALASPAFAEETPAPPTAPDTRIEADDQADVIRFFVKGQEVAVLDEAGLHVNGDLTYLGSMIDTDTSPPKDQ